MRVIPSSARARRRLFRFGIVLAAAGAIAGIAVGLQSPKQPNSAPAKNAPPAQLVTRSTRVSAHERRAINATLRAFLGAALDRSSPATAWRLAGPEMKSGSTLRQWRAGTSPVPYFPTRENTFSGWEAVDAGPGYVVFDHLLVHPRRGSNTSASIFAGEVIKRNGHWLVNRLYTIAVMKRPTKTGTHQVGPQDYAAPSASSQGGASQTSGGSLGKQWLLVGAGIVGLALLFPLGFAIASALRSRRSHRQYTEHRNRDLPPLPRSLQAGERR